MWKNEQTYYSFIAKSYVEIANNSEIKVKSLQESGNQSLPMGVDNLRVRRCSGGTL